MASGYGDFKFANDFDLIIAILEEDTEPCKGHLSSQVLELQFLYSTVLVFIFSLVP